MTKRLSALAALASILTGCSSPGTAGGPSGALAPIPAVVPAGRLTPATFTGAEIVIHIPGGKSAAKPRFVSPSTQSAAIAITPAAGCASCTAKHTVDAGLTPKSAGCTSTTSQTTCTIDLALKAGSYKGSFTAYDGTLDSKNKPTGSILSFDQSFPIKVVTDKKTAVSLALDAVPHNVSYVVLTGSTMTLTPANWYNYAYFDIAAGATADVEVLPLDADNNVIVGPGAPKIGVAGTNGFTPTVSGDIVHIVPPSTIVAGYGALNTTLSGPGCNSSGAVCAFTANVYFDSVVAIGNHGNNSVVVWPNLALQNGSGKPYATIAKAIHNPVALTFANTVGSTGDLFVANYGNNTVTMYAPPYTAAPAVTMTKSINQPIALAINLVGDLAVANAGTDTVEIFSPPYTGNPVTVTLANSFHRATAIAFDSSENLWIAEVTSNVVNEWTKSSNFATNAKTLDDTNNLISEPNAITFDVNSSLFVGEEGSQEIDQYTLASGYTGHPAASVSGLGGVTALTVNYEGQGSTMAGCYSGGARAFDTDPFQTAFIGSASATCVPAFSRNDDLLVLYPSTSSVVAYRYARLNAPWHNGVTFTSPLLDSPESMASWP